MLPLKHEGRHRRFPRYLQPLSVGRGVVCVITPLGKDELRSARTSLGSLLLYSGEWSRPLIISSRVDIMTR